MIIRKLETANRITFRHDKLTLGEVDKYLKKKRTKRQLIREDFTPGMYLQIDQRRGAYYYEYRPRGTMANGKRPPTRTMKLGAVSQRLGAPGDDVISLHEARALALATRARVGKGEDPHGTDKRAKNIGTVSSAAKAYLESLEQKGRSKGYRQQAQRYIDRFIDPYLGHRLVDHVTTGELDKFLHYRVKPGRNVPGAHQRNRVAGLLSAIFQLAIKHDTIATNPARGLEREAEPKRTVHLDAKQLESLGRVLNSGEIDPKGVALIRLLLFTGARRSEWEKAKWSQIDRTKRTLTLTDHKTANKTATPKTIHLSDEAWAEIDAARKWRVPGNDHIFPGRKWEYWGGLTYAWEQVGKLTKAVKGVRLHDLRHTHASVARTSGVSLDLIGSQLGHKSYATTERYAHMGDDPVREATAKTASAIGRALELKK